MINEMIYEYEDEDGDNRSVEVHFEFIPGSKGIYTRLPEDCEPYEGPEVHILYLADPRSGNELTEDQWPVSEENLIDGIIEFMLEEPNEN